MGNDFAAWQQEHSPDRKEVPVCFNRKLLYDFEEAAARVAHLKEQDAGMLSVSDDLTAAEIKLSGLRAEIEAAQKTLVFESIGTKRWRDLISEHPPTDTQRNLVTIMGIPLEFNPDTFVPVSISECCVEPGITLEQAEWFCSQFPVKEIDRVFGAVLTVNVTGLERPFDDGARVLHGGTR